LIDLKTKRRTALKEEARNPPGHTEKRQGSRLGYFKKRDKKVQGTEGKGGNNRGEEGDGLSFVTLHEREESGWIRNFD